MVTALLAVAAVTALGVLSDFSVGVRLVTSTLLVMGGTGNPGGLTPSMQQELGGDPWYPNRNPDVLRPVGTFGDGYIDTENNVNSPFYGWDFRLVEWPAQIALPVDGQRTYEQSQHQGVRNIDAAIRDVLPTLGPGEKAVAVGYSSSANVIVREMRALQSQPGGPPATDQLEFMVVASPNRPNGGIAQRFPGLYIPLLDIGLDGSTPLDTPYQVTDIGWEYDAASDFPNYPINLLADLNSLLVGSLVHGNYFQADMNGQRAFPDTTVGNITYVTLKPAHLPLLMPLYYLGVPKPLLDLVEPSLTTMVDWGYDRSISPGTPTPAQLIPKTAPRTAVAELADSAREGIQDFVDDLKPAQADRRAALAHTPANARAAAAGMPSHHPPAVRRVRNSPRAVPGTSVAHARPHTSSKAASTSDGAAA